MASESQGKRPRGSRDTFACPHCGESISLVGTKEAIELLSTTASTFQSWKARPDFPAPLWDAGQGALWRKEALVSWYSERSSLKALEYAEKLLVNLDDLDGNEDKLRRLMEALEQKAQKIERDIEENQGQEAEAEGQEAEAH